MQTIVCNLLAQAARLTAHAVPACVFACSDDDECQAVDSATLIQQWKQK
jgi:hypothetical protein